MDAGLHANWLRPRCSCLSAQLALFPKLMIRMRPRVTWASGGFPPLKRPVTVPFEEGKAPGALMTVPILPAGQRAGSKTTAPVRSARRAQGGSEVTSHPSALRPGASEPRRTSGSPEPAAHAPRRPDPSRWPAGRREHRSRTRSGESSEARGSGRLTGCGSRARGPAREAGMRPGTSSVPEEGGRALRRGLWGPTAEGGGSGAGARVLTSRGELRTHEHRASATSAISPGAPKGQVRPARGELLR